MALRITITIDDSAPGEGGDPMDELCARLIRDAARERRTPEMQALHYIEFASGVAGGPLGERAMIKAGCHMIPQDLARAYREAALRAAGIIK